MVWMIDEVDLAAKTTTCITAALSPAIFINGNELYHLSLQNTPHQT